VKRISASIAFLLFGYSLAALDNSGSTWNGYVTDTHCGTHCQRTSDMKPDAHCIRMCVQKGSKYGLWSGNKVYVLEPQSEAAAYAASHVEVQGALHGETIRIQSIRKVAQ
jgi:hypothetical protein